MTENNQSRDLPVREVMEILHKKEVTRPLPSLPFNQAVQLAETSAMIVDAAFGLNKK